MRHVRSGQEPVNGPSVSLETPEGDRATVLLHGAHVVSWLAGGVERLYLSPTSRYGAGAAVRGGVPVIFPQFNQRGPDRSLPKHGIVRTLEWVIAACHSDSVVMRLSDDDQTRALWPHAFELKMTVSLAAGSLDMTLAAVNTGADPFAFTAALHSYFAIGDIDATEVRGLAGVRLLDTVKDQGGVADREAIGEAPALRFSGETDRIYWNVPAPLTIISATGAESLLVSMAGFEDAVVWNPWRDLAASLPDLPDEDWRRMLCVEAARIGRPVTLQPGALWSGRQTLKLT